MIKCPKCSNTNIEIERRPDGYCACLNCKHRWKNSEVEKPKPLKQIYIKTDMTEMPKGCADCPYDKEEEMYHNFWGRACSVYLKANATEDYINARPEWCPLVEMAIDTLQKHDSNDTNKCLHSHRIYAKRGPHLGEYCALCGKWLRWAPTKDVIKDVKHDSTKKFENKDDESPF